MAVVTISRWMLVLLLHCRFGVCSLADVENWRFSVGAFAVGLVRLAAGWRSVCSVLGLWSAAGGSGAIPRRRRRERPDLEVGDRLGIVSRPACHSDRWALLVLLLVVHKAVMAMELLQPWVYGSPSSLVLLAGAGVERWIGVAEISGVFVVFLSFPRGLSAICTELRLPLVYPLYAYSVLCMAMP